MTGFVLLSGAKNVRSLIVKFQREWEGEGEA